MQRISQFLGQLSSSSHSRLLPPFHFAILHPIVLAETAINKIYEYPLLLQSSAYTSHNPDTTMTQGNLLSFSRFYLYSAFLTFIFVMIVLTAVPCVRTPLFLAVQSDTTGLCVYVGVSLDLYAFGPSNHNNHGDQLAEVSDHVSDETWTYGARSCQNVTGSSATMTSSPVLAAQPSCIFEIGIWSGTGQSSSMACRFLILLHRLFANGPFISIDSPWRYM